MKPALITVALATLVLPTPSFATITPYYEKPLWEQAVSSYATITFQELPVGTWVSNQYETLGITFDLNVNVGSQIQPHSYYLNDGVGLNSFGAAASPVIRFQLPRYAIAVDTPSPASFWLYFQGTSVGNITIGGVYFKGIVSTLPFDTVLFMPQLIDDLFFGPPIPAPGALALCGVVLLMHRRRRRLDGGHGALRRNGH